MDCCKCALSRGGTKYCEACALYYCHDCCTQRHSKGAFLRHEITDAIFPESNNEDNIHQILCDECSSLDQGVSTAQATRAVLKCHACELNYCQKCSDDLHMSGTMQSHAKENKFDVFATAHSPKVKAPTEEATFIGSGLSKAIAWTDLHSSPCTSRERTSSTSSSSNTGSTEESNAPTPTSSHALGSSSWRKNAWESLNIDSSPSPLLSKDAGQWSDVSFPYSNSPTSPDTVTFMYKSLNSLPAVNGTNVHADSFRLGRPATSEEENTTVPSLPSSPVNTTDVVSMLSLGKQHSRYLILKNTNGSFDASKADVYYSALSSFGDIAVVKFGFAHLGLILVSYFSLHSAVQACFHLNSAGLLDVSGAISDPERDMNSMVLLSQEDADVSFSVAFETSGEEHSPHDNGSPSSSSSSSSGALPPLNASVVLFLPSQLISKHDLVAFCSQWGPVVRTFAFEANPDKKHLCGSVIEFSDVRHAHTALREMDGLLHWGGELRTQSGPLPPIHYQRRTLMFQKVCLKKNGMSGKSRWDELDIVSPQMANYAFHYSSFTQQQQSFSSSYSQHHSRHGSSQGAGYGHYGHSHELHHSSGMYPLSGGGYDNNQHYGSQHPQHTYGQPQSSSMRSMVHPMTGGGSYGHNPMSPHGHYLRGSSLHHPPHNGPNDMINCHFSQLPISAMHPYQRDLAHQNGLPAKLPRGTNKQVGRHDQGSGEFNLILNNVKSGLDVRTTLMIRNIPNKYTQYMLLNEINHQHKELYDFFYLPIDFKNKCNMGYAFINFIDSASILPFYQEFSSQKWRNFNSEKICAISYARLQGKQAMIARFQNSSLLDKDESYRPLVFFSSGVSRGKAEPFPLAKISTNMHKHVPSYEDTQIQGQVYYPVMGSTSGQFVTSSPPPMSPYTASTLQRSTSHDITTTTHEDESSSPLSGLKEGVPDSSFLMTHLGLSLE